MEVGFMALPTKTPEESAAEVKARDQEAMERYGDLRSEKHAAITSQILNKLTQPDEKFKGKLKLYIDLIHKSEAFYKKLKELDISGAFKTKNKEEIEKLILTLCKEIQDHL